MHPRFTRKAHASVSGNIFSRKNGWITLQIYGSAHERGFAHGVLLYKELRKVLRCFAFLVHTDFHITLDEYVRRCKRQFRNIIETKYPEYYDELVGIHRGAMSKGVSISVDLLIAWNSCLSMTQEYSIENTLQRCSAFIATGNATENGDIVMAHNTHCNFIFASLSNIVLYVIPTNGFSFCMQTCPGMICSSMDWFICSSGIVGCETTISNTNYTPIYGVPYYCRIRDCMQYCNSLDEYANTMLRENAGDYACSWLFGDTRTGEIMLFEIGLNKHYIQKTKDGVFYGMNSAIDTTLRIAETGDTGFNDITRSSGARHARLDYLLNGKYAGKINIQNAKLVLADHYDVLIDKYNRGLRSICNHTELSYENSSVLPTNPVKKSVYPHGTIDGKVVNTKLAKSMQFIGKYGASCNRTFRFREYLKKHPEFSSWEKYLVDLPNQKWTNISMKDTLHFSKTRKIDFK